MFSHRWRHLINSHNCNSSSPQRPNKSHSRLKNKKLNLCVHLTLRTLKSFCGFTSACTIIMHITMTAVTAVVLMAVRRNEAAQQMGWKVGAGYLTWVWSELQAGNRHVQRGKWGNVCFPPDPPTWMSANHHYGSGNSGQVLKIYVVQKHFTHTYRNIWCLWFVSIRWNSCGALTSQTHWFHKTWPQTKREAEA